MSPLMIPPEGGREGDRPSKLLGGGSGSDGHSDQTCPHAQTVMAHCGIQVAVVAIDGQCVGSPDGSYA